VIHKINFRILAGHYRSGATDSGVLRVGIASATH